MAIHFNDTDSIRYVVIDGRLDGPESDAIGIKFSVLSNFQGGRMVVDISKVTFLASLGIRLLVVNAKNLKAHGGRMVLFVGDNESVAESLEATGISALIPMFTNLSEANQASLVSV
jgi:anti-anti-sigma factor